MLQLLASNRDLGCNLVAAFTKYFLAGSSLPIEVIHPQSRSRLADAVATLSVRTLLLLVSHVLGLSNVSGLQKYIRVTPNPKCSHGHCLPVLFA